MIIQMESIRDFAIVEILLSSILIMISIIVVIKLRTKSTLLITIVLTITLILGGGVDLYSYFFPKEIVCENVQLKPSGIYQSGYKFATKDNNEVWLHILSKYQKSMVNEKYLEEGTWYRVSYESRSKIIVGMEYLEKQ